MSKRISTPFLWIIGILIVLVLWAGSYIYFSLFVHDLDWDQKGGMGDSFGAVNALFSGLAFLAVVITIYIQSKALRESRADIELQNFENKFFQLVRVHNDILDGIVKYRTAGNQHIPITGRQRLAELYSEFIQALHPRMEKILDTPHAEIIQSTYDTFFKQNEDDLGHYFRHLYNIVAYIDRTSFSIDIKNSYTKLLRAQLSRSELALLFYNCLWEKGRHKFKPLVETYALLEHLPTLKYDEHRSLYDPTAFRDDQ